MPFSYSGDENPQPISQRCLNRLSSVCFCLFLPRPTLSSARGMYSDKGQINTQASICTPLSQPSSKAGWYATFLNSFLVASPQTLWRRHWVLYQPAHLIFPLSAFLGAECYSWPSTQVTSGAMAQFHTGNKRELKCLWNGKRIRD